MDGTQRKIIAEKLHSTGVHHEVEMHEIYRCMTVHSRGLTEKELAYLLRTREMAEEVGNRLHKLRVRCQGR